jgi:beta-glucosidase
MKFPSGFLWGAATASYQIEGAASIDGRGPSIWDTFSHMPGKTRHGDTGDIAADHYRRLDEDLDLMGGLGLGAYRFSIAWPRIQPEGAGKPNQRGLDFYRRLVEGLRGRGIEPIPTLYHWDLPQALQDRGGWVSRETSDRFAEYAAIVAGALGDQVERWITLNEPWCSAWLGYGTGAHAPGARDFGQAAAATHHLLLGHGQAVRALRGASARAQVGITLNLVPVRAGGSSEADLEAVRRVDGNHNRLFLDPIFRGSYPEDMLAHYASRRPGFSVVRDHDLEVIGSAIDFLGVNYYYPRLVVAAGGARGVGPDRGPILEDLGADVRTPAGAAITAMGWTVEPDGLTELLLRLRRDYPPVPIYITENGVATHDYITPEGRVDDPDRVSYLEGHLRALHAAIEQGVDVRGYFVWTLMDNFEWAHGYSKRFGLVFVEYRTQARVPKDSYHWYREVIAANSLRNA